MTILGIGNDIIEVDRIKGDIDRFGPRFLDRLFTPKEQKYCFQHQEPAKNFAGRFAAKEALVKAIGTGFREGITWLDIEIINDAHGKPSVELFGKLKELTHPSQFFLSISHCREYATAVVIWSRSS